jgi:hypothetical protein
LARNLQTAADMTSIRTNLCAAGGVLAIALCSACVHQAAAGAPRTTSAAPTAKAGAATESATPPAPPKELPQRQDLPLVLRETLRSSMDRHGEELTFLLADVVLLQYEQAEQLAEMLANEPKLGRPVPGDTESLNALLPESFFLHQSQLGERAKLLAKAAREKDDAGLVKAFGALAETCVGCHSSYLHDPLHALPDHDEGGH